MAIEFPMKRGRLKTLVSGAENGTTTLADVMEMCAALMMKQSEMDAEMRRQAKESSDRIAALEEEIRQGNLRTNPIFRSYTDRYDDLVTRTTAVSNNALSPVTSAAAGTAA